MSFVSSLPIHGHSSRRCSRSCYLVPVIGGFIADSIAGKFNVIYGSGLIYVLGTFLLVASAVDYRSWLGLDADGLAYNLSQYARSGYFLTGLFLVALGTGGIKANVGPYGAEQAEGLGENAVQTFFNWFYFFINTGSFIAYSAVAYIQQNISFAYGFLVPLISMILAIIFLLIGRRLYKNTPIQGSLLSTAFKVIIEGCKRRDAEDTKSLLDRAKRSHGGSFADATVEGIKSLGGVIPVFLTIVMYWAIYSQMSSTFFLQSVRMDVRIGSLVTPAAALNLFNVVIILILIPFLDIIVYPCLARVGRKPSLLQRIGFGMILAALSVITAGILEIYRKKDISEMGAIPQVLGDKTYNASSLSMFLQVPQFALIGASEVFTSITGLEFAYSEAPSFLKGLIMGLFLVTSGIGSYVSVAIQKIVEAATVSHPWFPDEINTGNVEYFFFLLGGLMFVDFLIFLGIAKCYKYKNKTAKDTPETEAEMEAYDNRAFPDSTDL
ncbi:solute carrier family 15 member 4-like isoform X2 [Liolophura sinensis]|uniref:solute carrier family 15 member 4-like isoform X2 n=1 Tax=Liolophura sinensis TaxID=3198878 RepID=UPI003158181D